jgi:hypothetical protein
MKPAEAIHAQPKQHWYKCFLLVIALFTFSIPLCKASSFHQTTSTEVSVPQLIRQDKSTAKYSDQSQIEIARYLGVRHFNTVLYLISHALETSIEYKRNLGNLLLIQPILNTSMPRLHFAVDEIHSVTRR